MAQVRLFRAFGLALVALMLSLTLAAQTGDAKDLLLKKLNEQFVPTKFTADKSDIVTAGVVVALKEDGLFLYHASVPMAPVSVPKKGKLTQGFGDMLAVGMVDGMGRPGGSASIPNRKLVTGEKVWVRAIELAKDSIMVQVVTDPYDDGRYFATIKFLIPKGTVPTPEDGVKMVSEVLEVQQAQDQNVQQPAPAPAPNPALDAGSAIQGKYIDKGNKTDFVEFGPNGVFTLSQGGTKFEGTYIVDGETITASGPQLGQQKARLIGDTIVLLVNGTVYEKQAEAAPASASAPMPEIAPPPPPPPSDAPPPTIEIGQTKDQVIAGFGQPARIAKLGAKEIFIYKDMKVTFTNGKVSNVE